MPIIQALLSRDNAQGERDLGAGAIAGIIIGIVIVALVLLALLVWRIYTYRTNRDFFDGRTNALYPAQYHPNGHVRSTRGRRHDSTLEMETSEVNLHDGHDDRYVADHRTVGPSRQRGQEADEKHLMEETFEDPSSARQRGSTAYPSETNRASWWWRPTKRATDGSDLADVDATADDSNEVQSEVMASEHNSASAHNSAQAHLERDGR
jgi:hypothetical protein